MDMTYKEMVNLLDGIAKDSDRPINYSCNVFNPQTFRREWHIILQEPYRRVVIVLDMSNKLFQLVGKTAWVNGIEVLDKLGEMDKRFVTLLAIPRERREEGNKED